jgi:hypothetical protein
MGDAAALTVRLAADIANFQAGMNQAKTHIEGFQSSISKAQGVLGGFLGTMTSFGAGFGGGLVFSDLVSHAAAAQSGMARAEAVVRALGSSATMSAREMGDFAGQLSKVTNFSRSGLLKAETQLSSFGGISDIRGAAKAAADLASVFGDDLSAAAETVARALESPTEAYAKLRRAGIALSAEEQDRIAQMAELGDASATQGAVLDALSKHVGGVAEAMRDTFEGRAAAAQKKIEELTKMLGQGALKAEEFALQHQGIVAAFAGVASAVAAVTIAMKGLAIAEAVVEAMSGPKGWATLAVGIAAAGAATFAINKLFNESGDAAQTAATGQNTLAQSIKAVGDAAAEQHASIRTLLDTWKQADFSKGFAGAGRVGEMTQEIMKAEQKMRLAEDKMLAAKKVADITTPPPGSIREGLNIAPQAQRTADYEAAKRAFKTIGTDMDSLKRARDMEQDQLYTNERRKQADAIRESTVTPKEKFQFEQQRISDLFKGGFLDANEATRGLSKAGMEFQRAQEKAPPEIGALAQGSKEAYSQALKNSNVDKIEPLLKTAQDALKQEIDQVTELRAISRALGGLNPQGDTTVAF